MGSKYTRGAGLSFPPSQGPSIPQLPAEGKWHCSISPRSDPPVAAGRCSITFCFRGVCTAFAALSQGLLPSQGGTNCISALSVMEVMQWRCCDLMRTQAKSPRTSSLLVQQALSFPPRKALLSFNLQCSTCSSAGGTGVTLWATEGNC